MDYSEGSCEAGTAIYHLENEEYYKNTVYLHKISFRRRNGEPLAIPPRNP